MAVALARPPFRALNVKALAVLSMAWFLYHASTMANAVIVPYLAVYSIKYLHQDVIFTGLLFSVSAISSFLVRIPAAFLADRYGTRLFMILGAILTTASFVVLVSTVDPTLVMVSRVLLGSGGAMFQPSVASYFTKLKIEGISSRDLVTYTSMGIPTGNSLGQTLGSLLFPLGFFAIFAVSAAVSASMLIAVSIVVGLSITARGRLLNPPVTEAAAAAAGDDAAGGLLTKRLALLLFTRGSLFYALGTQFAFYPLFLTDVVKLPATEVGIVFATGSVFAIVARPLSNILGKRVGDSTVVKIGTISAASSLALLVFLPSQALVWLVQPLLISGLGMIFTVSMVQVVASVPLPKRTQGLALFNLVTDVGSAAGSGASAFLLLYGGYTLVFGFSLAIVAAAFLLELRTE